MSLNDFATLVTLGAVIETENEFAAPEQVEEWREAVSELEKGLK